MARLIIFGAVSLTLLSTVFAIISPIDTAKLSGIQFEQPDHDKTEYNQQSSAFFRACCPHLTSDEPKDVGERVSKAVHTVTSKVLGKSLHDAVVDANTYVATCVAACVQELGPVGIHTRYAVGCGTCKKDGGFIEHAKEIATAKEGSKFMKTRTIEDLFDRYEFIKSLRRY